MRVILFLSLFISIAQGVENEKTSNMTQEKKRLSYLEVSFSGAVRGLGGLPIEHPFDCVKTKAQSSPLVPLHSIVKDIYLKEGWKGFYSGIFPNSLRVMFKQFYRWPLMIALPKMYGNLLPERVIKKSLSLNQIATGLTIASIETFLVCSLERLKVWLMTAYKTEKIGDFFNKTQNKKYLKNFLEE